MGIEEWRMDRNRGMTQQGRRRTSVEGTYVGLNRRGKSLKKLAVVLLSGHTAERADTPRGEETD